MMRPSGSKTTTECVASSSASSSATSRGRTSRAERLAGEPGVEAAGDAARVPTHAAAISRRGDAPGSPIALGEARPRTPRRPRCRGRRGCRGRRPPCRAPSPPTRIGAASRPITGWSARYWRSSGRSPARSRSCGTCGMRTTCARVEHRGEQRAHAAAAPAPVTLSAEATNAARSACEVVDRGAVDACRPVGVTATRHRSPSTSRPRRAAYGDERGDADQRRRPPSPRGPGAPRRDRRSARSRRCPAAARPGAGPTGGVATNWWIAASDTSYRAPTRTAARSPERTHRYAV